MSERALYPGRSWIVEYNGPVTKWPTYFVGKLFRSDVRTGKITWRVFGHTRPETDAVDGDYEGMSRVVLDGATRVQCCGTCFVAVDTTGQGIDRDDTTVNVIPAVVLATDGEWMVWADAQRWELKGFGSLVDAVQTAVNRVAALRTEAAGKGGPVDPFEGRTPLQPGERPGGPVSFDTPAVPGWDNADTPEANWLCDDCHTSCTPDQKTCPACGLARIPVADAGD